MSTVVLIIVAIAVGIWIYRPVCELLDHMFTRFAEKRKERGLTWSGEKPQFTEDDPAFLRFVEGKVHHDWED